MLVFKGGEAKWGSSYMPNIVAVLEDHRHKSNSSFTYLNFVLLLKRVNVHKFRGSIYFANCLNGANGEIHCRHVAMPKPYKTNNALSRSLT